MGMDEDEGDSSWSIRRRLSDRATGISIMSVMLEIQRENTSKRGKRKKRKERKEDGDGREVKLCCINLEL